MVIRSKILVNALAVLFKFAFTSLIAVAGICSQTMPDSDDAVIQTGRYTERITEPGRNQFELLSVITWIRFPEEIKTVGQAVRRILQGSGYRLATAQAIPPESQTMLQLPLPEIHRVFEAIPLGRILNTLVGPSFVLIEDPLHRLISFKNCPAQKSEGEG